MKTSLLVLDDFLRLPHIARKGAVASDFGTRKFQGASYKGVGGTNQPLGVEGIITRALNQRIEMVLSFYRIGTPGNEPTTYIHADRNCAKMAGVLYLNPTEQCRGGTAFWKHKETGRDSINEFGPTADYAALNGQGNDESNWEMTGLVPMKFNRFVCYPTDVFHSRYPKEGWGGSVNDGRLIWVCFFNLL